MMDPALLSILRHNGVPTDEQTFELRRCLDAGEAEVSQLGHTIATLTLVLSELQSRLSRQTASLHLMRGAMSAIRHIPAELLGHIFLLYAEDSRMSITNIRKLLVLEHVCSRWRMVSQGLPRLWDRVVLATTSIADVRTASIMRHLLARSGNLPLSLSIRNMSWPWVILRDGSTLFFDILWESHSRLQHVTLEIPHKSARVAPRNKQFPLLALLSLTLLGDTEEGDSDVIALLNSFRHAPALRSLDLVSEQKVVASFAQSPFPWSRLRDLRLRMAITLLDARTILVQCHRLERARISVGRRLEEFSPGISTLPNLRELYFAIPDDGPSAAFFEAFAFPNVERLAIDVGELSIEAFQGFYTRSNFSLQHLHLERIDDMMVDDLLAFLRVMPTLRTLSVINCGCCIEPGLFEIFTHHPIPSERAIGLPKLTKLLLGLDFDMDGTSVADMAESLSQHRGRDSEFPDLEVVYLMTYSRDPFARYEEAVETRLAAVAETDFLQREISPAPANITEYTDEDWELWM